jgi:hypothetical protein
MAFPHLRLLAVERGRAKLQGGGKESPEVKANKANRTQHAGMIRQRLGDVSAFWAQVQIDRAQKGLPPIPGGIPFLLRIPERSEELLYRLEKDFGVTIVAQFNEGFLMVASEDITLAKFQQITTEFENEVHGATAMASILDVYDDGRSDDRLQKILSPELVAIWPLVDTNLYILDVSIQTAGLGTEVSNPPKQRKEEGQRDFERRKHEWEEEWRATALNWDEKQIEAEVTLAGFLRPYDGQIVDQVGDQPAVDGGVVKLPDSISVRIRMSGQGFTDLIKNYPRVFDCSLPEDIEQPDPIPHVGHPGDYPPVAAPGENAPAVCVIDSGIQENHQLLQPAIDAGNSRSFLAGQDVADRVAPDGHGTPVAGAVLYRDFAPGNQNREAVCWIQNARLLNDQAALPDIVYPPLALREIITHYRNGNRRTRIFNHSIAGNGPCRTVRMSTWGAEIDLLSHELDVLVIQAAGNIPGRTNSIPRPGIIENMAAGRPYPNYLREAASRVSNPGQSLQAITVGSIGLATVNDGNRATIGGESRASAFSRSGWGLWETFKPEVVEIGGDYLIDATRTTLSKTDATCPELVRCTYSTPGAATTRALVGTSFAAPRVAGIAALLQSVLPDQPTLLYRALIIQSARWPAWMDTLSPDEQIEWMKSMGYGIPDPVRASENTERRVTLVTEGIQTIHALEAAIYTVDIPAELRSPGNEFDVRIEVTLSYSSKPRRTRSSRHGYQEIWLDWIASKKGESLDDLKARAIKGIGEAEDSGKVDWMLHERKDWGILRGIHRQASTVQKDWVVLKAHELPETFAVAVRGHNGWSKDPNSTAKFALAVTIDAEACPVPIYARIQQEQSIRLEQIQAQAEVRITSRATQG